MNAVYDKKGLVTVEERPAFRKNLHKEHGAALTELSERLPEMASERDI